MTNDDTVESLLAELDRIYPDPVDVFEDLLAAHLGLSCHPATTTVAWRRHRVDSIEAAGDRADAAASVVEELLRVQVDPVSK